MIKNYRGYALKNTKTALVILFIIPFSFHLYSQESKMNNTAISEKYSKEFDIKKLDSLYPESEFKRSPIT